MTKSISATSSAVERFLRYVTYDTQSSMGSKSYPSTPGQLVLLDLLVEEMRAIGIRDAARDAHGYVTGTIPATSRKPDVPVIGFFAHVDTSPETSGKGVKPIVHRQWQGGDIVLPDDPGVVLRAAEIPNLREQIGHDIITASGTTLLGADNKAGVAEIMAAAERLLQHPEIPHGTIRIAFTPDEEIGHGTDHFDVKAFGAVAAYTLDAAGRGTLEMETFSANSFRVTFEGINAHPGFALDRMTNAVKVMADFLGRLPREGSPERTAGREGFVHPIVAEANVEKASVLFIVRDFSTPELERREAMLRDLGQAAVAAWPGSSVSIKRTESYRNMKEVLDRHPDVVENAREAIRRAGLEVRETAIRGGTDGSRLCFMGLPTPNIFAGENNFHSKLEWVSADDMEKAVETIVLLAQVWEERAAPAGGA
jgi:tripeptide aminopeptidase